MMRILLIGPPGSGKGTQAEKIIKEFNIPHISSGQILRDYYACPDELLPDHAVQAMSEGKLVKDDLINYIISERLKLLDCKKGFVLDGYPRNLEQVKALKVPIDAVIELHIPSDLAKERMVGRRRNNENKETIENRLATYRDSELKVADYYRKQGNVLTVFGDDDPERIYEKIRLFLEACKV